MITTREAAAAWQHIATSAAGKTVIDWMVERFGFTRSSLHDADPGKWGMNEGQRMVVVEISKLLDYDLDHLEALEKGTPND